MGGAMMAATALPETIPILHAAVGCAASVTWAQNGGGGLQVAGYCGGLLTPSSNVQEREVVFGGDARLREQIRNTIDVMNGRLYFVVTGCVTEIIGDDVRAIVEEFKGDGIDIINAETAGFKGNSYVGYDLLLQSLFRDFVERWQVKVKGRVNVWGIAPFQDVFWRGNLEGIRDLLEKLGLEVNTFFTSADCLDAIKRSSSAELNIVVSDVYGVNAAKVFEDVHGVPFITTPLPIGPSATDAFLKNVGSALALDADLVDRVIASENTDYFKYLDSLTDCYSDLDMQRYAVVVGDSNYAPALTRFLADDLGWLPKLSVITDNNLNEDEEAVLASRWDDFESGLKTSVVFETDTSEVIRHLNDRWPRNNGARYYNAFSPAFVVGSSLDRELALSLGAGHLSVGYPVANRAVLDRGYTGYRGGLRLTEDLLSAIIAGR
jgi:nitrogenase molybdenum-iron protein beta chain